MFYKMKSKKEAKNLTTDTITVSYNHNVKWKENNTKEKLQES